MELKYQKTSPIPIPQMKWLFRPCVSGWEFKEIYTESADLSENDDPIFLLLRREQKTFRGRFVNPAL